MPEIDSNETHPANPPNLKMAMEISAILSALVVADGIIDGVSVCLASQKINLLSLIEPIGQIAIATSCTAAFAVLANQYTQAIKDSEERN